MTEHCLSVGQRSLRFAVFLDGLEFSHDVVELRVAGAVSIRINMMSVHL